MDEKPAKKLLIQAYKKAKRGTIKTGSTPSAWSRSGGWAYPRWHHCAFATRTLSQAGYFDSEGLAGLEDRPRPGRPPKVEDCGACSKDWRITTPKQLKEKHTQRIQGDIPHFKRHKDNAPSWPVCQDGPSASPLTSTGQRSKRSGSGSATPKGGFHACKRRVFSQSSLMRPYL